MVTVDDEIETQEGQALEQEIVSESLSRSAAVTAKDVVPPTLIVTLLVSGEILGK